MGVMNGPDTSIELSYLDAWARELDAIAAQMRPLQIGRREMLTLALAIRLRAQDIDVHQRSRVARAALIEETMNLISTRREKQ